MHAHTPTHNLWFWPKRPPLAFSLAETSVAEMSGPKRPRPKCPWPKCPTFRQNEPISGGWQAWVRLAHCETGLSPPEKYFYWPFQGGASFVVTCWKRADLLTLICEV